MESFWECRRRQKEGRFLHEKYFLGLTLIFWLWRITENPRFSQSENLQMFFCLALVCLGTSLDNSLKSHEQR
jgi:hypothetical protein